MGSRVTTDTDLARIAALQFPGSRLTHVERLTGGVSADVYRLDLVAADGRDRAVVVRVHGPSHAGHEADFACRCPNPCLWTQAAGILRTRISAWPS